MTHLFCTLDSYRIADLIRSADRFVCYAGPGVQVAPAQAMAEVAGRVGVEDAESLIQKMQLDVRYKDVTFEILNQPDFLQSVKDVFPCVDWDKAYEEFRAAGEAEPEV